MAKDDSGLTDEFQIEMNPVNEAEETSPQLPALPKRPADGAGREEWVSYVVALGGSAEFVNEDTEHYKEGVGPLRAPALTVKQLKTLAEHLGG